MNKKLKILVGGVTGFNPEYVKDLEEVVAFYAENKNWHSHNIICESDVWIIDKKIGIYVGGKRAREVREKYE